MFRRCFLPQMRQLSDDVATRPKIRPPTYQKKKKFSLGKWLMLGVPIATFGLGTWQVQRRSWKTELIEKINQRTSGDPQPLPKDIDNIDWKELEYCKFYSQGEFDHTKELYIQPRTLVLPKDNSGGGSLISTRPQVGAYVVTPFFIPERGYSILVKRGFVDRNHIDPNTRLSGQVTGQRTITGILRITEKSRSMPSNIPEKNQWGTTDVEKMAKFTDSKPIFLDLTADCTVAGGPVGGQTRIRIWNQHFSYIITWYSLSALTFAIWFSKYVK